MPLEVGLGFVYPNKHMLSRDTKAEPVRILSQALFWSLIAIVIGLFAGCASAALHLLLDAATDARESHVWIIALLPLAGLATGMLYHTIGKSIEGGNNLIIDEIHEPKAEIPFRMAPLILLSTGITHLFGGSAGREGTAVQMSAALADQLSLVFKKWPKMLMTVNPSLNLPRIRRIFLMAGLSAGFGSVFGTPLAGAVFGLEVLAIGRMDYEAILPCFVASVVGNLITLQLGIHHFARLVPDVSVGPMTITSLLLCVLAGAIFGGVGTLFAFADHSLTALFKRAIPRPPLRPVVGGVVIAALVFASGSTRYIGLGIPTIVESFQHSVLPWDFALKLLFTVITLSSGFKGGEVTPLFFIGATLGNALAWVLPLPLPLLTAMGFVGVFAGAANVPVACSLMAVELFGAEIGVFAALACVASYVISGHQGIYRTQRVGLRKLPTHE